MAPKKRKSAPTSKPRKRVKRDKPYDDPKTLKECYICLEKCDDPSELYELHPCAHLIHRECFLKLRDAGKAKTCPLCQATLTEVIRSGSGWGSIPPNEQHPAFQSACGVMYDWQWNDKRPNDTSHLIEHRDLKTIEQEFVSGYEKDMKTTEVDEWRLKHSTHKPRDITLIYGSDKLGRNIRVSAEWTPAELKSFVSVRCGFLVDEFYLRWQDSDTLTVFTFAFYYSQPQNIQMLKEQGYF